MGHGPGGFRVWWQALTGSEETLDNAHLMRLAGPFAVAFTDMRKPMAFRLSIVQPGSASMSPLRDNPSKCVMQD
jgi:hypothetical protein